MITVYTGKVNAKTLAEIFYLQLKFLIQWYPSENKIVIYNTISEDISEVIKNIRQSVEDVNSVKIEICNTEKIEETNIENPCDILSEEKTAEENDNVISDENLNLSEENNVDIPCENFISLEEKTVEENDNVISDENLNLSEEKDISSIQQSDINLFDNITETEEKIEETKTLSNEIEAQNIVYKTNDLFVSENLRKAILLKYPNIEFSNAIESCKMLNIKPDELGKFIVCISKEKQPLNKMFKATSMALHMNNERFKSCINAKFKKWINNEFPDFVKENSNVKFEHLAELFSA